MTRWQQIARTSVGPDYARRYAERFRRLAERGDDVHGEATFVAGLVEPPARVLDAGCGTGRVAIRLAELGYDVVGVDVDASMLLEARDQAPELDWRVGDLAALDTGQLFDVVLVAGNTIPLLEPGTLGSAATHLAAQLDEGGLLVCGFGLDEAHLPGGCPVTTLAEVDAAFAAAGLAPVTRYASWDRAPYDGGGYVVTVDDRSATTRDTRA
ncbi:class I SAM-dependent methyltransferase [Nocardioides anomalus]|uniref:Class I SAM-dependent methyltransferase n=1 Tax=Nocardioides anomalus TaxID=2712223 RepID=A0A6G6WIG3_9ACTN|nr:class I SAM-dependent methyltransferase [Nocardioides anomalus]QIG44996.1 class I SAM-dependent methyltransferase [Nocardioides anomalus]